MRERLFVAGLTAFVVMLVGLLIVVSEYAVANISEKNQCDTYARVTGRETYFEWSWNKSCYVKTDKGTFLLNQVRSLD